MSDISVTADGQNKTLTLSHPNYCGPLLSISYADALVIATRLSEALQTGKDSEGADVRVHYLPSPTPCRTCTNVGNAIAMDSTDSRCTLCTDCATSLHSALDNWISNNRDAILGPAL